MIMELYHPVIVLGPPRSGTSNIARILSRDFGLKMFRRPFVGQNLDLDGVQEDLELAFSTNAFNADLITLPEWWEEFTAFIDDMYSLGVPWGFKEPRLGPLVFRVLKFLPGAILIRCIRSRAETVHSMMRKLSWPKEVAEKFYDLSHNSLDFALARRPHLRVQYRPGKRFPEKEIIKHISRIEAVRFAV